MKHSDAITEEVEAIQKEGLSEMPNQQSGQDLLPQDTVHCFPANPRQILRRRLLSILFLILLGAAIYYFLRPDTFSYGFVVLLGVGAVVCILVFIQSFLIAGYRVAIDYERNEVVLRYMFRKLAIPFTEFDCREGEPDRSQKILEQSVVGKTIQQRKYLILDNVNEDACYQTSSYDLASIDDFLMLQKEAEQISSIFKAKDKLLEQDDPESEEDQTDRIISEVMKEMPSAKKGEKAVTDIQKSNLADK